MDWRDRCGRSWTSVCARSLRIFSSALRLDLISCLSAVRVLHGRILENESKRWIMTRTAEVIHIQPDMLLLPHGEI